MEWLESRSKRSFFTFLPIKVSCLTGEKGISSMDFNQWTKLLELANALLQTVIWPLVILIILLYLRKPIKKFMDNLIEVNLKAGPLETTAKRQQLIEAAASLGAATAHWEDAGQEHKALPDAEKTKGIAKAVEQLITSKTYHQLEGASILWVDDNPLNNTYERQALEAFGIQFTISKSTEDALGRLQRKHYDVIISDMARPPEQQAGYTLLEKVKAMNLTTPFIIYAGSKRPEHITEARKRGAFGTTNEPQELFELVMSALKNA
jgi:Response regulator containing CheY-like receiver, AAA-type ATPase, and DNA-binding domains